MVITGSHNFSISASESNDENFVVVKANQRLAFAYAVACMATYNHYRWRIYVNEQIRNHKKIWSHLETDPDAWQEFAQSNDQGIKFLDYWIGQQE